MLEINADDGKTEWNLNEALIYIPMINGDGDGEGDDFSKNAITLNSLDGEDQAIITNTGLENSFIIGMDKNLFENYYSKNNLLIIQDPETNTPVAYTVSYVDQDRDEINWGNLQESDKSKTDWQSVDKHISQIKDVFSYDDSIHILERNDEPINLYILDENLDNQKIDDDILIENTIDLRKDDVIDPESQLINEYYPQTCRTVLPNVSVIKPKNIENAGKSITVNNKHLLKNKLLYSQELNETNSVIQNNAIQRKLDNFTNDIQIIEIDNENELVTPSSITNNIESNTPILVSHIKSTTPPSFVNHTKINNFSGVVNHIEPNTPSFVDHVKINTPSAPSHFESSDSSSFVNNLKSNTSANFVNFTELDTLSLENQLRSNTPFNFPNCIELNPPFSFVNLIKSTSPLTLEDYLKSNTPISFVNQIETNTPTSLSNHIESKTSTLAHHIKSNISSQIQPNLSNNLEDYIEYDTYSLVNHNESDTPNFTNHIKSHPSFSTANHNEPNPPGFANHTKSNTSFNIADRNESNSLNIANHYESNTLNIANHYESNTPSFANDFQSNISYNIANNMESNTPSIDNHLKSNTLSSFINNIEINTPCSLENHIESNTPSSFVNHIEINTPCSLANYIESSPFSSTASYLESFPDISNSNENAQYDTVIKKGDSDHLQVDNKFAKESSETCFRSNGFSTYLPEKSLPLKKKAKMKGTVMIENAYESFKYTQVCDSQVEQEIKNSTNHEVTKLPPILPRRHDEYSDSDEPLSKLRKKMTFEKVKEKNPLKEINLVSTCEDIETDQESSSIEETDKSEEKDIENKELKNNSSFGLKKTQFKTIRELVEGLKTSRIISESVWEVLDSGLKEMKVNILEELNREKDEEEAKDSDSYSAQLKAFALILFFKQPSAFHILANIYQNSWPSLRVVKEWKRRVNNRPRRYLVRNCHSKINNMFSCTKKTSQSH